MNTILRTLLELLTSLFSILFSWAFNLLIVLKQIISVPLLFLSFTQEHKKVNVTI